MPSLFKIPRHLNQAEVNTITDNNRCEKCRLLVQVTNFEIGNRERDKNTNEHTCAQHGDHAQQTIVCIDRCKHEQIVIAAVSTVSCSTLAKFCSTET